jgi:hypothetical protein
MRPTFTHRCTSPSPCALSWDATCHPAPGTPHLRVDGVVSTLALRVLTFGRGCEGESTLRHHFGEGLTLGVSMRVALAFGGLGGGVGTR